MAFEIKLEVPSIPHFFEKRALHIHHHVVLHGLQSLFKALWRMISSFWNKTAQSKEQRIRFLAHSLRMQGMISEGVYHDLEREIGNTTKFNRRVRRVLDELKTNHQLEILKTI